MQPKPKGGKKRESYANFNLSEKVRLVDEYLKIPEKLRNLTTFARQHGVKRKTFNTWVDNRRAAPEDIRRNRFRTGPYETVAKHLVEYINLRKRLLSQDKIGLDWAYLKMKALKIAEKVLSTEDFEKFRASDGFIHKCLKRNDLIGVTLHGEGNEMSSEQLDQELRPFRIKIGEIIDHHNIPLERIYNADAYGLFYMKLPNRIYCNPKERTTIRGIKLMKDKNRLSAMPCFSCTGRKVTQTIVGKAARPQCWDLCDNQPPLPYTHQTNAWFDSVTNRWWFNNVFLRHYKKHFGELHGLLLVDNKGCEGLRPQDIPFFMHVEPFPPDTHLAINQQIKVLSQ